MAGYVVCDCCGVKVPAAGADIGRAVVCPTSRRLVPVTADTLREAAAPPVAAPVPVRRGRRRLAVLLLLLLALGLAGGLGTDRLRRKPTGDAPTPGAGAVVAGTPAVGPTQGTKAPRPPGATDPGSPVVAEAPGSPVVAEAPGPANAAVVIPGKTDPAAPPAPAVTAVVQVPAAGPDAAVVDARGLTVHRLMKRIDLRTADELDRELQTRREVALDTPAHPNTSANLYADGIARRAAGAVYGGPAVAAKGRDDLAGLGFKVGADAVLSKDKAEALDALSKRLRAEVQKCIPADKSDPRPDPDKLHAALLADGKDGRWAKPEAVPCVQQMLQAEGRDVRRVSVELLRGIPDPAATDALVRWAVFDLDPANRAAAVDALRARDRATVVAKLVVLLRYPWARAAEHAAEALVALDAKEAVPDLAALLPLPAPDEPGPAGLSGESRTFRRELVRVNHARNCLMCHAPSAATTDLVRGAIPDPSRPIAPPVTPGYYGEGSRFVTASATYLWQDFSAALPVKDHGPWPAHQRYDFLVAVRPAKPGEASAEAGAYRAAVLWALRELSGENRGDTAEAWAVLRAGRASPDDRLSAGAGRFLALYTNPEALIVLGLHEFGPSFFDLTADEQTVVLSLFRRQYGVSLSRSALIAYLDGVVRTGPEAVRDRAAALLVKVRGDDGSTEFDPVAAGKLLRHGQARYRRAAAEALEAVGGKASGQAKLLADALADQDTDVRRAAAVALGKLPGAADEVYVALAKATADDAPAVRVAAADALVRLKDPPKAAAKPLAEGLVKRSANWASADEQKEFQAKLAGLLAGMKGRAGGGYGVVLAATAGEASDV
ncbi:MAG: HEAT repeat domain-containing protein, partial [Gemmataceae bacterium]|nr:HEAT repeat domain-containing protein [Gemmataceae bacterium]